MRRPCGRSLSQSQAIMAPNKGTVAFRMADKPVLMARSANEKQANGMAELSTPTKKTFFQCLANWGQSPRHNSSGPKNRAAMDTRRPAVGMAPNSWAPRRMNRKDEPQMAASRTNSVRQGLVGGREFKVWFLGAGLARA